MYIEKEQEEEECRRMCLNRGIQTRERLGKTSNFGSYAVI